MWIIPVFCNNNLKYAVWQEKTSDNFCCNPKKAYLCTRNQGTAP